ncbi:SpoIIE family protein phosphatase [Tindallia californiensis]|uniref:Stage 0 sporulation protein A homolog n=1 Tax=Tindallia californiensis TaxID=159292 RepID=A0A1H3ICQ4_9FIRM|nr:SpoIIE family protein phosphatase [Tindallia californiensis]SDY25302.1 sigma-B regulation protein RsbU (phosphoserine phosphatase) [Tindallia californiensis]
MKTGKILILEMLRDGTQLNKQRLRSWGHEVVQYEYDQDVHYHVISEKPDLILLQSIGMTGCDIEQCCRTLKSIDQIKKIPLLVQIGMKEYQETREALYMEGVNDCLPEPIMHAELKVKIQHWLNYTQHRESLRKSQQALEESMQKINRQRAEIDHHLSLAARIQESLIPKNIIEVPRCSFYCHFQPSGKVGGDIYDIFMLDHEHVGLYMIDVMGHGVASSMIAVALSELMVPDISRGTPLKRQIDRPPYYEIISPGNVIQYLNKRFSFSKYQHYFTIFYMVLNTHTGILRYCRGAHPEPLWVKGSSEIDTLNAYGTPIGFEFSQEHEEGKIQLNPGDRLFIYSDGLMELEDNNREAIDYEKLLEIARKYQVSETQRPMTLFFKRIAEAQGELKDDLTLVEMVWEPG